MRIAFIAGFIVAQAGFTCSTDSGTLEGNRSSQEDCADSPYCNSSDEVCWTDDYCGSDDDGCSAYGDDSCHKDCTEDEACGGAEQCTFVGSDTWLCI